MNFNRNHLASYFKWSIRCLIEHEELFFYVWIKLASNYFPAWLHDGNFKKHPRSMKCHLVFIFFYIPSFSKHFHSISCTTEGTMPTMSQSSPCLWTRLSQSSRSPCDRYKHACCSAEGNVYILGGRDSGCLRDFWRYSVGKTQTHNLVLTRCIFTTAWYKVRMLHP